MESLQFLDPSIPKSRAVAQAIRAVMLRGELGPGDRLPTSRELAADWGIARNTVVAAVDDLIAEGLLEARQRAGVFVARTHADPDLAAAAVVAGSADAGGSPELDLRPGRPEHGSFPSARWRPAMRRALSAFELAGGSLDDRAGLKELRVQLAAYLRRARGVETTAESIVICGGFRAGSTVLAAAMAASGASAVAIEDPSLPGIDRPWRAAGFAVTDLAVDAVGGAQVERLGSEIDAVLLTPSHQFPLGGALTPARRQRVVEWANQSGGYIVEDDYDGEFRFDRRPIAALQRAVPERTVYIGSVSKTLDPGLRLGWLVLPRDLVSPVVDASDALTGGASVLTQLALAAFLESGDYERQIRRQRREYARRRAVLQRELGVAGYEIPGIPAGLHTLVPVAEETAAWIRGFQVGGDGASTADTADTPPVAVHLLERYTRRQELGQAVVAGFATPQRSRFEPAVAALVALLGGAGMTGSSRTAPAL